MTVSVVITSSGVKNATIQVTGSNPGFGGFGEAWQTLFRMGELPNPPKHLHLDAVYHALAEGMEVQLAWRNDEELHPIMPLAGRGRIDFNEVSGVQSQMETHAKEVVFRVVHEAKNPNPCFLLVLDFSKHQGTR